MISKNDKLYFYSIKHKIEKEILDYYQKYNIKLSKKVRKELSYFFKQFFNEIISKNIKNLDDILNQYSLSFKIVKIDLEKNIISLKVNDDYYFDINGKNIRIKGLHYGFDSQSLTKLFHTIKILKYIEKYSSLDKFILNNYKKEVKL